VVPLVRLERTLRL